MKLHLGCGYKYLEGWVNVDGPKAELPYQDLKADIYSRIEDLNYAEDSVDEILMEAAFEHFPRHVAITQLSIMYRWLKPGGRLTILVPDFWGTVTMLRKSKSPQERQFWYRHLFGPQDSLTYGTHYDAFDIEKLEWIFSIAGFRKTRHDFIKRWPYIRFVGVKEAPAKAEEDAIRDIAEYLSYCETSSESGIAFNTWMNALGWSIRKPVTKQFKTHEMYRDSRIWSWVKTLFGRYR